MEPADVPDRNVAFSTYATYGVRWKVGEEKRRLYASRYNKNRIERERSLDELAATTFNGIDIDNLSCLADFTADPAIICEHSADVAAAWDVVDQLPWDDRQIAYWYWADGTEMAEIGKRLGVTESRISQRMRAIKTRLRRLATAQLALT